MICHAIRGGRDVWCRFNQSGAGHALLWRSRFARRIVATGFNFLVSFGYIGCADRGSTDPEPDSVHETQVSSGTGESRFASGGFIRLFDAVTQLPVSGAHVTEISVRGNRAYIIVDVAGRYRSEAFEEGTPMSTLARSGTADAVGLSADVDVYLVPLNAFGGVVQGLNRLSDRAWQYVLERFYTHERMTMDGVAANLATKQIVGLGEHVILGFLTNVLLPVGSAVLEVTSLGQMAIANWVNWYLVNYYQGLGYLPTDLFDVSTPTAAGSLFLNTQIIFRPVGPPSGIPALPGALIVRVLDAAAATDVSTATVEVIGPASQRASYRPGGITLNGIAGGNYTVQVIAPGYRPGQMSIVVSPGTTANATIRLSSFASAISISGAGGTFNFPGSSINATAFLVVVRAGIDIPATLRVTGPPGWNAGRVHTQALSTARAGSYFTDWLYFVPPATGLYSAQVVAGGATGSAQFFIDAARRMAAPTRVVGQLISLDSVEISWQGVTGVAGYGVAIADGERCDERGLCATIRSVHVPSSARSWSIGRVGLRPGQRYFAGVYSLRTPLFASPPPVPDFFDIGYSASPYYTAPPALTENEGAPANTRRESPWDGAQIPAPTEALLHD